MPEAIYLQPRSALVWPDRSSRFYLRWRHPKENGKAVWLPETKPALLLNDSMASTTPTFITEALHLAQSCYAPINVMPHYPPTRAMLGNRWGFEFCKVQMHHPLGTPVGQIPTFAPLNNRGKDGEFDRQCF